jgi:acyl carrier protein
MNDPRTLTLDVIAQTLGVEPHDIAETADFTLDLNATKVDMQQIKATLEEMLEVVLPDFEDEEITSVNQLMELVEDSLL